MDFRRRKLNNYFMNLIKSLPPKFSPLCLAVFFAAGIVIHAGAQANAPLPAIEIQADKVMAKLPPTFYGLMTEEINYSYEGGLYGELIRNRSFKADAINEVIKPENYDPAKNYPVKIAVGNTPKFWQAINAEIALDTNTVLNAALNVSLRVDTSNASKETPAGVANGGYWGIPLRPNTSYHASFFAKSKNFSGPLTVALESADGKKVYATAEVAGTGDDWKKFEATLTIGEITPSKDNRLVITTTKPGTFFNHHGTVWLQQVSLFPPTYKNRPNGDRADISQLLADAQPKFLRMPGGNYVEGDYFNERFNWKQMVGPVDQRPGHRSCWGYWSTDGFGLPEFLGWCQDLNMEPVLAVFAGYTLRHDVIPAGDKLAPYVQEALDEIEYVTGDASTKWGAQRVKDGYPNPFTLHYVEIGNEEWFDRSGSYDGRFAQFYDAIRAKYPQLKLISTIGYEHKAQMVTSRVPDVVDEHYYESEESMEAQSYMYDSRDRAAKSKIFVGEWATRVGSPTPNMAGALGDAAWMCSMERNADIVMMHCYAPLFVNVSDLGAGRSMQWKSDLIGYDALRSYGSPSYYAQKMFSQHTGDEVLGTLAENLPTYDWQPPAKKKNGNDQPSAVRHVKSLFYSATRDSKSGKILVKIVNRSDAAQEVKIAITGANHVADTGTATVLKAANRDETNSLADPQHVVPVMENVSGLGNSFTRTYPPCSITILELGAK
jgi:alpha-L-arabinofuranosidase